LVCQNFPVNINPNKFVEGQRRFSPNYDDDDDVCTTTVYCVHLGRFDGLLEFIGFLRKKIIPQNSRTSGSSLLLLLQQLLLLPGAGSQYFETAAERQG